jgi:RNA polymerase sigma-70 factor (ECF subfamily)
LLAQLARAVETQDPGVLLAVLAKDATWTSDGGGKRKAAKKIVSGAEHVARFALGVFRRNLARITFVPVTVNDEAGLAARIDDQLLSVITIRTDGQKILGVYSILNPDKLPVTSVPAAPSGV